MQRRPVVLLVLPALIALGACSSAARESAATTPDAAATSDPTADPPTSAPASTTTVTTVTTVTTAGTVTPTTVFTCRRTPASWDDDVRLGDCDTHGFVRTIEDRLTVLGFPCTVDDQFRSDTDVAVRNFQRSQGLTVDGQVGPNTWAALTAGGIGD